MISMREAYEKIGANYDDACARLMGEEILARFALKFLDDESMDKLEAAATFCSYVYLACLPSMDSSTSLPNDRYTQSHCLTVPRGTDSAFAADL